MYLYTHTVWYSVSITHPTSLILHSLKVVWPCLAVIGGLDSGFYLGRECRAESKGEVMRKLRTDFESMQRQLSIALKRIEMMAAEVCVCRHN